MKYRRFYTPEMTPVEKRQRISGRRVQCSQENPEIKEKQIAAKYDEYRLKTVQLEIKVKKTQVLLKVSRKIKWQRKLLTKNVKDRKKSKTGMVTQRIPEQRNRTTYRCYQAKMHCLNAFILDSNDKGFSQDQNNKYTKTRKTIKAAFYRDTVKTHHKSLYQQDIRSCITLGIV